MLTLCGIQKTWCVFCTDTGASRPSLQDTITTAATSSTTQASTTSLYPVLLKLFQMTRLMRQCTFTGLIWNSKALAEECTTQPYLYLSDQILPPPGVDLEPQPQCLLPLYPRSTLWRFSSLLESLELLAQLRRALLQVHWILTPCLQVRSEMVKTRRLPYMAKKCSQSFDPVLSEFTVLWLVGALSPELFGDAASVFNFVDSPRSRIFQVCYFLCHLALCFISDQCNNSSVFTVHQRENPSFGIHCTLIQTTTVWLTFVLLQNSLCAWRSFSVFHVAVPFDAFWTFLFIRRPTGQRGFQVLKKPKNTKDKPDQWKWRSFVLCSGGLNVFLGRSKSRTEFKTREQYNLTCLSSRYFLSFCHLPDSPNERCTERETMWQMKSVLLKIKPKSSEMPATHNLVFLLYLAVHE